MTVTSYTPTTERLCLLATQYRESPNIRAIISTYLDAAGEIVPAICDSFSVDIDSAEGDQLSLIGKILGFPRLQCGGSRPRVFGFECVDECSSLAIPIGGFCGNWVGAGCNNEGVFGDFEFTDDNLYRSFLKSLILKYDNDFTRSTLIEAVNILFGESATIYNELPGTVGVFTGRVLTPDEQSVTHLYRQVLPLAPGVGLSIYEGLTDTPFGFGPGWGGFCFGEFPAQVYRES